MIKVSIGIPAYNEQANIKRLLLSLLGQQQNGFQIREIVIVSDGSTDHTVAEVESIKSNIVRVVAHADRKGQAARQNEILEMFSGDILVLLNADIIPKDKFFLQNLIRPIMENNMVGLTSARLEPLPARGFLERVLAYSALMKENELAKNNGGDNIYACHGTARALSASFVKQFRFEPVISEDAYSYLRCKELGFGFVYVSDAVAEYRCPQTFDDYRKQSVRFWHGKRDLMRFIPESYVRSAFAFSQKSFYNLTVKQFLTHPILFTSYAFLKFMTIIASVFVKGASVVWEPSTTSKEL